MKDPFSLEGKTILVTGASSGIGRQSAIDFSYRGANVILIGRNIDELISTHDCCNKNVKCTYYSFDLRHLDQIGSLVANIVGDNGLVNGFLHAAGIEKTMPYSHCSTEDYHALYDINVLSAMELIKYLSKKTNRGIDAKYVLISSITALIGRPGVATYAASKGALISVVKTLAIELALKAITINCISPGTILTPLMTKMMETLTPEQQEKRKDGFLLGLGKVTDISNTATFLLSDAARWITGQNIVVDGGYTIQ